jgi:hypothetical protein
MDFAVFRMDFVVFRMDFGFLFFVVFCGDKKSRKKTCESYTVTVTYESEIHIETPKSYY